MAKRIPRIAIIRRSYRPDGGAEQITQQIIEKLKQYYPVKISMASQSWQGNEQKSYQFLQIKKRFCWSRASCLQYFIRQTQRSLSQHRFDLIQSHERIPGCQLYRAGDGVHAQWLKIRIAQSKPFKAYLLKHSSFHRAMCKAELDMFLHPALKRVICISKRVKQEILTHYPQVDPRKLVVIYNGIDIQKFKPSTLVQKQKLRNYYHFDENAKIALFVGSGYQRKGLGQLLKGLALSQEWQLVVIGKDSKQRRYEQQCLQLNISKRVHFVGMQTVMHDWYGLADLLIHPAWYEPFGNVILEAMASGLGVICTEQCGAAELITHAQEGYHLQQDFSNTSSEQTNENNFEQQIAHYLALCLQVDHFVQLGQLARKTAEKYSSITMINQIIASYTSLLKN